MSITREDIAWAAGLFEGEGCIRKTHAAASASSYICDIGMCDEDTINKFGEIFPFGTVYQHERATKEHPDYKKVYRWQIGDREHIQAFLAMMWPWLGERRRAKAREAILAGHQDGRRKLHQAAVDNIRKNYSPGKCRNMAEQYGVSPGYIRQVAKGNANSWKE